MADFNKNEEKSNYYIYNWGFSKYGQTGLENCQYTDEPNILLIPPTKDILSISSGEFNSSIIYKDNKTYLYGLNTFGQLGNGSNKEKSKKISNIPLLIQPIKFSKLSIGGGHILAISTENKLYSWGLNIFGQLGLGHTENIDQPTLVEKIGIFNSAASRIIGTCSG
jgi:alpha-tubulin suppressor-like RCC1 family protein